jgi:hypothetical protein
MPCFHKIVNVCSGSMWPAAVRGRVGAFTDAQAVVSGVADNGQRRCVGHRGLDETVSALYVHDQVVDRDFLARCCSEGILHLLTQEGLQSGRDGER